jgi:putative membrane protein
MYNLALKIGIVAIALLVADYLLVGITIATVGTALLAAVLLGIFNTILRPLLIILTLPVTVLTLGLFIIVINAALFGLAAFVLPGFTVTSFLSAFLGYCIVSVVSSVVQYILK